MRVETSVAPSSIAEMAADVRRLEAIGFDSVTVGEVAHDPFLPLMIVAEHTESMKFGTGVAIAFPRSPFVTAQMVWDLQRCSGGRFHLGLSQVVGVVQYLTLDHQVRVALQRRSHAGEAGYPQAAVKYGTGG